MRCCCCAVDIRIGGGAHKLNNMGFLYRNSLFEIRKAVCEFLRKILYLGFQKRFIQRTVDAFPESIEREGEKGQSKKCTRKWIKDMWMEQTKVDNTTKISLYHCTTSQGPHLTACYILMNCWVTYDTYIHHFHSV